MIFLKKLLSFFLAVVIAASSVFVMGASALGNTKIRRADGNLEFAKISADIVYLCNDNESGNSEQSLGNALRIIGRTTDYNYNFRRLGAQDGVVGSDGRFVLQFNDYDAFKYAMSTLSADAKIVYAERDTMVRVSSAESENTTFLSWGVEALGLDKYSGKVAENFTETQAVTVAIVDTGVEDIDFVKNRLVAGYDFVGNDSDAFEDTSKDSHGTFLASIITDCTQDAPVTIMPVRVIESETGYVSNVINGIYYAADNGADVINMSMGTLFGPCQSLEEAVDYAEEKGALVVACAGNSKTDIADMCPAHMDNVITVSAIDSNFSFASDYSNYGVKVDVAAPGTSIVGYGADGKLTTLTGTSMSAAFISSGAALFKVENPACTPSQVKYAINGICNDMGDEGFDVYYGNGIPDFSKLIKNSFVGVTGIELPLGYVECAIGSTYVPEYTVLPANATNKSVTFSSSNPSVAYIVNGVIHCASLGVTSITIKTVDGGYVGSFTISVREKVSETPVPVKMFVTDVPDKTEYVYKSGDRLDLTGISVTLVYSDDSIATTFNPDGLKATQISTDKAGKQTVTVEYEGFTAEFEITVVYTWWQKLIRILLLGFLWY